jgi:hypothetical protein
MGKDPTRLWSDVMEVVFKINKKLGLEMIILGVSNPIWFWFHARLVLVLEVESNFFFQNSNPPLALAPLRNLRPFLFVFSSLDKTPKEKWHDPLTTRCLVRRSLQSLQGERESRIGERKLG